MENILFDIGLIIIIAAIGGFIANRTKQPLVLAYIITGIILGPVFGLVKDLEIIHMFSEIGIAFLLFIVGMDLNLKKLKNIGPVATAGAIAQMAIFFVLGFATGNFFGLGTISSVYIGLIIMFSSTMVVLKILSDKKQLDTLHSRIIIGTLITQDIIAIIALSLLNQTGNLNIMSLIITLIIGTALVGIAFICTKYIFPKIFKSAAKSQEVLFMISLAVCFAFAFLFYLGGFSIAVGAFVAGVAIGNLPYNHEIANKIKPLRDFFAVLFFTSLGLELVLSGIGKIIWPIIILAGIVIIIKPIVTILTISIFGFKKRVSFLTGLSLAQISEFGLILAAQGLLLGHISREIYTIAIVIALVSITTTSYFIKYELKVYHIVANKLRFLDKIGKKSKALELFNDKKKHKVVLCGYNRIGYSIFHTLQKIGKGFVVVEYNPDIIKSLISRKIPCIYGDLNDPDVLESINFTEVELVISTIPDVTANLVVLSEVKKRKKRVNIILTAYSISDALELYKAGADYVIVPHLLGGEHVSLMLENISGNLEELIKTKLRHINELHLRRNLM
jgi:Kef-type K+ transport system membrane component KefB/voltage-gated potassium channel Kch